MKIINPDTEEVIKEVEVVKEVEVPVFNGSFATFEEFISDIKSSYDSGTAANVANNPIHQKIDDTFKEDIFETTTDEGAPDFYLDDEEAQDVVDQSQPIVELEKEVAPVIVQNITIPTPDSSRLQKLYEYHSKIRPYELYFRGVCVYSSLTHRVSIGFFKDYAMVNGRMFRYAEGLVMRFLN